MKFKAFLAGILIFSCFVCNAKAQTPEDIWREYQSLGPPLSELRFFYSSLKEPYRDLAIEYIAHSNKPFQPWTLISILQDLMVNLPGDSDNVFHELWRKLILVADSENISDLLADKNIDNLPANLNWFVEDVVRTFLRSDANFYSIRKVACYGPQRYKQIFLDKFFAFRPSSFQLASAIVYCGENRELFLEKFLNSPNVEKRDLLNVLEFIKDHPKLYDLYFRILLLHADELDNSDWFSFDNICATEPYCSFFSQFKFSATLERRTELLEMMKKK